MTTYLVPRDTQPIVEKGFAQCDNLGLMLDRYVTLDAANNADLKDDRNKTINLRSQWLRDVCKRFGVNEKRQWRAMLDASYERWQHATRSAPARFKMQTAGRLIVGLGGKGALEIGITLQHNTGLPVIPGSALKGAARAYALYSIVASEFADREKPDLNKLDKELGAGTSASHSPEAEYFHRIFGAQSGDESHSGNCVFYDAVVAGLPAQGSLFEADIITPHFPEYYRDSGGSAPGDNQNPIPVTFLTVASGTTFAFAVGLRTGITLDKATNEMVRKAAAWLVEALQELGIGSKTAAGYGGFSDPKIID